MENLVIDLIDVGGVAGGAANAQGLCSGLMECRQEGCCLFATCQVEVHPVFDQYGMRLKGAGVVADCASEYQPGVVTTPIAIAVGAFKDIDCRNADGGAVERYAG